MFIRFGVFSSRLAMFRWWTLVFIICKINLCIPQRSHVENAFQTATNYVQSAQSQLLNSACRTWVIAIHFPPMETHDLELHFQSGDNNALLILSQISMTEKYLDKEYSANEVLFPLYAGPRHFSPQCQVVFVISFGHSSSVFQYLTVGLSHSRFIRVHKDYLFYIGHSQTITSFSQSFFILDIRHSFFLIQKKEMDWDILDTCAKKTQHFRIVTIFSRKCDTVLPGRHFIVTVVFGITWLRLDLNLDGTIRRMHAVYYNLLVDAGQRYNFTFQCQYSNHRSSGFKKNGLWFGSVGEVFRRQADIAVGCGLSSGRDLVIDNGLTACSVYRVFFIRTPAAITNWRAIFNPFQPIIWIFLLLTGLFLLPIYFLAYKLWLNIHGYVFDELEVFHEVVNSLVAIFFEQSSSRTSWVGFHIRFLVIVWMFYCLIIGAGYRSRLIYFLTFITPVPIPATHEELIQENYKIYFRYYGGIAYRYAAQSRDPVQRAITERAFLLNSSVNCILDAIATDHSACLDWNPHGSSAVYTNATLHAHGSHSLVVTSKDSVNQIMVAWIYRKQSPLTESFDAYFGLTLSSGLYAKWDEEDSARNKLQGSRWLKSKATQATFNAFNDISDSGPRALHGASLIGLFGLLIFGLFLSFLFYFGELAYTWLIRMLQKRKFKESTEK